MEDYGYKRNHRLHQFLKTMNSRRKCWIDLRPRGVKNPEFFNLFYSKPTNVYGSAGNQNLKLELDFLSQKWFCFSEKAASHHHTRFFFNYCSCYQKTNNIRDKT